ncbi:MAG TPA: ABC transporter substrate-binding protein [Thiobacillaceae bacterium]|nr:ABC transporter substrate-binding protein [Thiobacillaceae bacterium]HNU65437.1 ABC transporter substrate-binding protein [Thiobacillaceae bacterium]
MNRRVFLANLAALPWATCFAESTVPRKFFVFGQLPPPGRIRRVFAAGAPAAVLAYVLVPDKLMGWPWPLSDEARALLARGQRDLPMLGRLAGRGSTLPLERLVALKPDLIIDAGTVDETYFSLAERVARETRIPYVLVDGRLADSPRQLRDCGGLLGAAERGERLARFAESTLLSCRDVRPQGRPKVYLARGADGLETPLPGSVNGECIEAACGVNAAPPSGVGGLARVSPEQVLAWAPDVIVTQYPEFHARAREDAFWKRLPAVRNGRLHLVPSQPFGWLDGPPGVNRLIGVRWLASRLHGHDDGIDWVGQARDFHRLFYGHAPEQDQLARLLAGV